MEAGIDPIVGVDLAVFDDDGDHRTQLAGRVVVLARGHNNGAGYRALCRLVSDAHARTSGKAGERCPWRSPAPNSPPARSTPKP
ncbi:DNA polymerase [Arthrobacter sp. Hiyo4]|nr:DNA polymerase [Arthrobacter sp. Hiyo4]